MFAPSSFFHHNIVVYEPSTSFRFNAGITIDIDIRLSNQKAKNNFSPNALSSFIRTPLYLQRSCDTKIEYFISSMAFINHHLRNQTTAAGFLINFSVYRSPRNKVIWSAKSVRQSYFREQLLSLWDCDSRRWWKHTKPLTCLGKTSSDLHTLANSLCGRDLSTLAVEISCFFESVSTLETWRPWTRVWFRLIALSLCDV